MAIKSDRAYRAEYMAILKACSDFGFSDTEDVPLSAIVRAAFQTLSEPPSDSVKASTTAHSPVADSTGKFCICGARMLDVTAHVPSASTTAESDIKRVLGEMERTASQPDMGDMLAVALHSWVRQLESLLSVLASETPVPAEPVRVCSLCQSGHIHDACDTVGIATPVPAGQTEEPMRVKLRELADAMDAYASEKPYSPVDDAIFAWAGTIRAALGRTCPHCVEGTTVESRACLHCAGSGWIAALALPPSPAPEDPAHAR